MEYLFSAEKFYMLKLMFDHFFQDLSFSLTRKRRSSLKLHTTVSWCHFDTQLSNFNQLERKDSKYLNLQILQSKSFLSRTKFWPKLNYFRRNKNSTWMFNKKLCKNKLFHTIWRPNRRFKFQISTKSLVHLIFHQK